MWKPTEDQASTNAYRVTVQATDDGDPPLTSQFTYSIHVLPSEAVLIVADVFNFGPDLMVEWQATVGKRIESITRTRWTSRTGNLRVIPECVWNDDELEPAAFRGEAILSGGPARLAKNRDFPRKKSKILLQGAFQRF